MAQKAGTRTKEALVFHKTANEKEINIMAHAESRSTEHGNRI